MTAELGSDPAPLACPDAKREGRSPLCVRSDEQAGGSLPTPVGCWCAADAIGANVSTGCQTPESLLRDRGEPFTRSTAGSPSPTSAAVRGLWLIRTQPRIPSKEVEGSSGVWPTSKGVRDAGPWRRVRGRTGSRGRCPTTAPCKAGPRRAPALLSLRHRGPAVRSDVRGP